MDLNEGPYAFIELSTDSETEEVIQQTVSQPRLGGRSRRMDTLIAHDVKLAECIAASDFPNALLELERMHGEARRERSGPPLVFLRRLKALEALVEFSPEKVEAPFRLLRAKLRRLFLEHEEALQSVDLTAAEQVFGESQGVRSKLESTAREEEEVDFAKRLKLPPDERRKFWQVKQKAPTRKEEERKRVVRQRTVREKFAKEKVDRFAGVALDVASVTKKLEDLGLGRHQLKEDERDRALSELEYIAQKGEGEWRWKALTLLAQMRLDAAVDDRILTAEDVIDCVEDLQQALEIPTGTGEAEERVKGVATVALRVDAELQLAICLAEPHKHEQRTLAAASVDLLKLLRALREKAKVGSSELVDLALCELHHIFGWPEESVRSLDFYLSFFSEKNVEATARELNEIVKACATKKQVAKARLYLAACLALNGSDLQEAASLLDAESILSDDRMAVCVHNHTIALVGLRLVREGQLVAAKTALDSLMSAENLSESLGQFDFVDSMPWDAPDPRALLPSHLHVSLPTLKAVFLISCLVSETHLFGRSECLHPFFAKTVDGWMAEPPTEPLHKAFEFLRDLRPGDAAAEVQKVFPVPENALKDAMSDEAGACFIEQLKEVGGVFPVESCADLLGVSPSTFSDIVVRRIKCGGLKAEIDGEVVRVEKTTFSAKDEKTAFGNRLVALTELVSLLKAHATTKSRSATFTAALQHYQQNFERRDKPPADTLRPRVTFSFA